MCDKLEHAPQPDPKLSPLDLTRPFETVTGVPVRVLGDVKSRDGKKIAIAVPELGAETVLVVGLDGRLEGWPHGGRYVRNTAPVVTYKYRLMFPNGILGSVHCNLDLTRRARDRATSSALIVKITFIDGVAKDIEVVDEEQ